MGGNRCVRRCKVSNNCGSGSGHTRRGGGSGSVTTIVVIFRFALVIVVKSFVICIHETEDAALGVGDSTEARHQSCLLLEQFDGLSSRNGHSEKVLWILFRFRFHFLLSLLDVVFDFAFGNFKDSLCVCVSILFLIDRKVRKSSFKLEKIKEL